jgi:hypothetical protein
MVAVVALTSCSGGASGGASRDVDFVVSIEGSSAALVIDYSLTNTGETTLVAYNRLENSPSQDEFASDVNRVYVSRDGDQVEIAKKIDHPCQDDPEADDCSAAEPVRWRIGGTILDPGAELHERIEMPARGEPGFVETRGKSVRFCLGFAVIDEDNPASPDALYPPTSPQTVLCSDAVTVADA